jgi:hypothetical protein
MEAYLFLNELLKIDHFSQRGVLGDKYLAYIAFCFTASNNRDQFLFSAKHIYTMIELSAATYHLDNYMETWIPTFSEIDLGKTKNGISTLFECESTTIFSNHHNKYDQASNRDNMHCWEYGSHQ